MSQVCTHVRPWCSTSSNWGCHMLKNVVSATKAMPEIAVTRIRGTAVSAFQTKRTAAAAATAADTARTMSMTGCSGGHAFETASSVPYAKKAESTTPAARAHVGQ